MEQQQHIYQPVILQETAANTAQQYSRVMPRRRAGLPEETTTSPQLTPSAVTTLTSLLNSQFLFQMKLLQHYS